MTKAHYTRVSQSWVAQQPGSIGVVEFYGGEFFGLWPATWYQSLLQTFFDAGYTIIAVPVQIGFNHAKIARHLLLERDNVRTALPQLDGLPHCWAGHSIGCKIIALLEAGTQPDNRFALPGLPPEPGLRGILDEPSLLFTPSFADTSQAIPIPWLARLINRLGFGARPDKRQTQHLIQQGDLFNLTGLISFVGDTIAGNAEGNPATSDVAWLLQTLEARQGERLLHTELLGKHMQPSGFRLGRHVVVPSFPDFWQALPRQVEQTGVQMLGELLARRTVV
ncbi:MAG: DUF1350 family protein [Roseiflexaceae bacterium]